MVSNGPTISSTTTTSTTITSLLIFFTCIVVGCLVFYEKYGFLSTNKNGLESPFLLLILQQFRTPGETAGFGTIHARDALDLQDPGDSAISATDRKMSAAVTQTFLALVPRVLLLTWLFLRRIQTTSFVMHALACQTGSSSCSSQTYQETPHGVNPFAHDHSAF
jgi:flagellar biosynthesis protein FliP